MQGSLSPSLDGLVGVRLMQGNTIADICALARLRGIMPIGIIVGPQMYQYMFWNHGDDINLCMYDRDDPMALMIYHGIPVTINPEWPMTIFQVIGFPREMDLLFPHEVPFDYEG